MINQKRLISTFIKLVRIDSISKKEKPVADFIKKRLVKLGIKSSFDSAGYMIDGNCGNLYAAVKGTEKKAPSIFLNAHIDTVIVNPASDNRGGVKGHIKPIIRQGIISSSGDTILGADCKAGVASIIEVLAVLKQKKIPHGDIKICFSVAEEIGLVGAKYCNSKLIKSDYGFVIDGGNVENIINGAPTQLSLEARVIGKAAHAGVHPEKGINAIKAASEAIAKMKIGRIDKETTANIGVFEGGVATNIVPEEAVMRGEARSHNKRKLKKQINSMTKALTKACRKYRAFLRVKVDPTYQSFNIKEKSDIINLAKTAMKKIGLRPEVSLTGGGSDANIFNEKGMPCLILGVGAHNVHTSKEYIAIKDFVKGTELILEIIKEASLRGA